MCSQSADMSLKSEIHAAPERQNLFCLSDNEIKTEVIDEEVLIKQEPEDHDSESTLSADETREIELKLQQELGCFEFHCVDDFEGPPVEEYDSEATLTADEQEPENSEAQECAKPYDSESTLTADEREDCVQDEGQPPPYKTHPANAGAQVNKPVVKRVTFQLDETDKHKNNAFESRTRVASFASEKLFSYNNQFLQNSLLHSERPYECESYNTDFTQKCSSDTNELHTGVRDFFCKVCGKSFLDIRILECHMSCHTTELLFSCEICKEPFLHKHSLQNHMAIHSGARPYLCEFCGKSFTKKAALNRHKRTHSRERSFSCIKCNIHFTRKAVFKKHNLAYH